MITATSAPRARNIERIKALMATLGGPEALIDDELVAMIEILKAASDRKQEPRPGVVYLDSVRSGKRRRR
jgi:hypothetical protein